MKRIILSTIILLFAFTLMSQSGDVTTMWPYKYRDFTEGTVYFNDKITKDLLINIHLLNSTLHYLDNGLIREANSNEIVMLKTNQDIYFMRNNQLMKVLAGDAKGFIAELTLANFNSGKSNSGAYGSSASVQATQKLTSLDGGAAFTINHMELKEKKDSGTLLSTKSNYYIVTENDVYPATKKGVEKKLTKSEQSEFKKFLKENKIKWKNETSLMSVLSFLNKIEH